MKGVTGALALVPLLALASLLALPVPAVAADHGLGVAIVDATTDCEGCFDRAHAGLALFGKIGFTPNWGLLVTWRVTEDDEELPLGEEESASQLAAQALTMWRADKAFRPHIKFGLEYTDMEVEIPGLTSRSDGELAPSFGGGFEAGSPTFAFFLDYDLTFVDLFGEDFDIDSLNLGIILKF